MRPEHRSATQVTQFRSLSNNQLRSLWKHARNLSKSKLSHESLRAMPLRTSIKTAPPSKVAALGVLLCHCLLLTGCLQTKLTLPASQPAEQRIVRSASTPLALRMQLADTIAAPDETRGYQYLLFALPWGRVLTPGLASDFARCLQRELALRGQYACADCVADPPLLELTTVSINAYDFLFLRKMSVALEARLSRRVSRVEPEATQHVRILQASSSDFAAFAFAPQLSRVYHRALLALAQKVIMEAQRSPYSAPYSTK
jgi:hypothetical protein